MTHSRLSLVGLLVAVALFCTACPSSGVYRNAKTADPGVSDFGLSWNVTRLTNSKVKDNQTGETESSDDNFIVPKIVPEVNFHVGIVDNVEAGGRIDISSGLLELDAKYRFFHNDKVHLAVQPAIGYQSLFFIEGYKASLPLIATYEIVEFFSVTAFGYGQYVSLSPTNDDSDVGYEYDGVNVGGGAAFTFEGETFYFTPMIEYSKAISDTETNVDGQTASAETELSFVIVSINLGWYLGKEKQQLDRLENKIDGIDDKLDKALEK